MNKSKILLISALSLMMGACSNNSGSTKSAGAPNDSTNLEVAEAFETSLNIRYVSMDSISKYYVLAQNVNAKAQGIAADLQSLQASFQNQLQQHANQIQQKQQSNGYLSEASLQADLKELDTKNARLQNQYAKKEQAAAEQIAKLQKELSDSIMNFIIVYNKEKKYDAILLREAGLFFNPALDITEDVIKGLNERYIDTAPADTKESK